MCWWLSWALTKRCCRVLLLQRETSSRGQNPQKSLTQKSIHCNSLQCLLHLAANRMFARFRRWHLCWLLSPFHGQCSNGRPFGSGTSHQVNRIRWTIHSLVKYWSERRIELLSHTEFHSRPFYGSDPLYCRTIWNPNNYHHLSPPASLCGAYSKTASCRNSRMD